MNAKSSPIWKRLLNRREGAARPDPQAAAATPAPSRGEIRPLDLAPDDPLLAQFLSSQGVVDVERLNLHSPTLAALRKESVKLALPLVSQGELIGLLSLGPRMSEQEYSSDDFRLLNDLGRTAAPALRIAQLARQQQAEARERERLEQELRVARIIQQTLLPKDLPSLPGWELAAHWQPAREVSGDFYDFLPLADGRLGVLVADVTDKGVPAAMVMATTRSMLRMAAERRVYPGTVLERTNDLLYPDIPARMFVTCLYLVFDPATGRVQYANAGHNVPYLRTPEGVVELRATGMPLGLMPGMGYEVKEMVLKPGESILLLSDGLVEAHNPRREMFGLPRLKELVGAHPGGASLIPHLMDALRQFTGSQYEQEDDITLVTIERLPAAPQARQTPADALASFSISSQPGNERDAAARVLAAIQPLGLPQARLKRLETAVAEATMNAMEHGNQYRQELPVEILALVEGDRLKVHISDRGSGAPARETQPDLDAKLSGEQTPRGWGLFLIRNMVDEVNTLQGAGGHTIELVLKLDQSSPTPA